MPLTLIKFQLLLLLVNPLLMGFVKLLTIVKNLDIIYYLERDKSGVNLRS